MATLQNLKTRIKSVKSTGKMTNAMKLVAASKLRKSKKKVISLRPYGKKIKEIVENIASDLNSKGQTLDKFPLLSGFREKNNKHLFVIFSSDRGLRGGLNNSVVKIIKNEILQSKKSGKEIKIISIGKKAYDQLSIKYKDLIIEYIPDIFKKDIDYKVAKDISHKIIDIFTENKFETCSILYNEFKSAILQKAHKEQIIPVKAKIDKLSKSAIKYEQNREFLLESVIPENITTQIYCSLLENSASEHGARMAAMEAATTNSKKMVKSLSLTYNRARQANITRELIDIVSGANASS